MWRIAWANVRGNLLRTFATAMSVVFGVAFVVGTFVLTDTVREAFETLFSSSVDGADLIVAPTLVDGAGQIGASGVDAAVAEQAAGVDGVAATEPRYRGLAKLAGDDDTTLGGLAALTQGIDAPSLPGAVELRSGRLPSAEDEIAIDAASAQTLDAGVGETTDVVLNGPRQPFRIVGIVAPPDGLRDLAGSTTVVFPDDVARDLYGQDGATYIAVRAADGVELEVVRNRLTAALDADVEVLTTEQLVNDAVAQAGDFLTFITRSLLVFAGAALIVGAVIIFNTFSITVAQRTRELAIVQAVGADSPQVLRAVIAEAMIIGVIGSAIGVLVGAATAVGLRALLRLVSMPLPATTLQFHPRTAVIGMVVGTVVTTAAAVAPALRAARRAPVDAMRSSSAGARSIISPVRLIIGALVGGVAVTLLAGAALDRGGLVAFAVGAAALTLTVVLLAPLAAAPLTRFIAVPVRVVQRMPARLARANAARNPGRTAATATALMIGLGLVTFVLILVASFRASLEQVIVEQFRADYQLQAVDQVGFPTAVTEEVAEIPGVELVSATKVVRGTVDDVDRTVFAVDAATLPEVYDVGVSEGRMDGLRTGGVAVSDELGAAVGSDVALQLVATGQPVTLPVAAVTDDVHLPGTTRTAQVLVDVATLDPAIASQQDLVALVKLGDEADAAAVRAELETVVAEQPDVQVADAAGLRAQVRDQTDRLLTLVIGLALLSVAVAFVGVVNALGLSVVERSDELGLLQALGMSRRQARQMVRTESLIITLLGSALGLAIGTTFGWLGVRVLRDEGLTTFAFPATQIGVAIVVMLVAGVTASVIPARRASHVDVLRAVTAD